MQCRTMLAIPLLVAAAPLCAQVYPAKVVRINVPTSAGGGGDVIARLIAKSLSERWNRQVVVDNRTGAGTMLGSELVARAAPDGYTLLMTPSTLAINPAAYKSVPYDALRDFAPITQAAVVPNLMMVHPSVPAKNVREMIALAKARPGQLFYASSGHGTSPHLSLELFKVLGKVDMTHIAYKGSGSATIAHLSGEIIAQFPSLPTAMGHIKSNRLRALGEIGRAHV